MSVLRRPMQLLQLPDELLSLILQHVSAADKQQRVQRSCMRLRRLLKHPLVRTTWGSIGVRLPRIQPFNMPELQTLLHWLASRHAGIIEVRLIRGDDSQNGLGIIAALCAMAGALAPGGTPLLMEQSEDVDTSQVPEFTWHALASTLQSVVLVCRRFQPQQWRVLCLLRSLQKAELMVDPRAAPPVQQPQFTIESMQLTSLRHLHFRSTDADLIAPLMAHATALTALTTLRFSSCSLGTLPAGVLNLPQLASLGLYRCELTSLPSLAPLMKLEEVDVQSNPALMDLRPALAAMHRLRRLGLRGSTPLTTASLDALQGLCGLQELDVRGRLWSSLHHAAVFGHLVRLSHDKGCTLLA